MPIISKKSLRQTIKKRLLECGFKKNGHGYAVSRDIDKKSIRKLYAPNRQERALTNSQFLAIRAPLVADFFASGHEICPEKIDPEIVEVRSGTKDADLFRLATMFWSVPVSQGFGRRMRFLIKDRHNGKLIGVFALGDPVFNLSARDDLIGWSSKDREKRLIHVMDAYIVGSVPPYSSLIGGKLVAALMCSSKVKRVYERRYLKLKSVISKKKKNARLALITTTSALGRSSIYNRLKLPSGIRFERIGSTKGFGHFHLSGDLFEQMRKYLLQRRHPYAQAHQFGMGPNWKIRVARAAVSSVGLSPNGILKHGVAREVYIAPLAKNWKKILTGENSNLLSLTQSVEEIADFCRNRWMLPRSKWDSTYKQFDAKKTLRRILSGAH